MCDMETVNYDIMIIRFLEKSKFDFKKYYVLNIPSDNYYATIRCVHQYTI